MVGRERELQSLLRCADRAAGGVAQNVELVGEAGIGKTLLLDHAEAHLRARGVAVFRGRASEFERGLPFRALIDALADLPHGLDDVGDGEHRRSYALHQQLRGLLQTRLEQGPISLIIDDTQWADPASVGVLETLIERPLDGPLLMVLAHRPHQVDSALPPPTQQRRSIVRIAVGPIDVADAEELLLRRFRSTDVSALHAACGGNPFHLQELARTLDPRLRIDRSGVPTTFTTSVARLVASELSPLGPTARRLLNAAAVVGDPFEIGLAQSVAELTDDAAFAALDQLLEADVVRASARARWFTFRHPLIRRCVYDTTGAGWRLTAHRRAAEALRCLGAGAAARAHHMEQCAAPGDEQAIALLTTAGTQAVRAAPASAAQWLCAAWTLTPEARRTEPAGLDLLRSLVLALTSCGRGEEAVSITAQLIETVGDRATRSQLELGLASTEALIGQPAAARTRLRALALEVLDPPSVESIPVLLTLANLECGLAELDDARHHTDQALAIADTLALPALRAFTKPVEASVACFEGDLAAAGAACDEAARSLDSLDTATLANFPPVLGALSRVEFYLGRYEAASRHIERGLHTARGGQWPVLTVNLQSTRAMISVARGELGPACAVATAAAEEAVLIDSYEATVWAELARSAALEPTLGAERAVEAAERALVLARDRGFHFGAAAAGQALARALLAVDLPERVIDLILHSHGGPTLPRMTAPARADSCAIAVAAAAATGDQAAVMRWTHAAAAAAERTPVPIALARAGAAHAIGALARGEPNAAAAHAAGAADHAAAAGAALEATRLLLLAAQARVEAGHGPAVVPALRAIEAACSQHGADRLQAQAVRLLRQLGRRVSRSGRDATILPPGRAALPIDPQEVLTARQLEICRLAATGLANRAIAAELFLSVKAVEAHLSAAYLKLGVRSRKQLPEAFRE